VPGCRSGTSLTSHFASLMEQQRLTFDNNDNPVPYYYFSVSAVPLFAFSYDKVNYHFKDK
jgi:hypothetical protein